MGLDRLDMKILLDIRGNFGIGDYLCMDPMLEALQIKHRRTAKFFCTKNAGNLSCRSDFFVIENPADYQFDLKIPILGYKELGVTEYQILESMSSLTSHMASYASVDVSNLRPRVYLTESEVRVGERLIPQKDTMIACCTDFSDPRRHLPLTTWEKFISEIGAKGFKIVLVGEKSLKSAIGLFRWHKLRHHIAHDLQGKLSVRETAAVISRCRAFVGNNSGLFHYAQAVDTDCVVTMSVNKPDRFIHNNGPKVNFVVADHLPCIYCTSHSFAYIAEHQCVTNPKGLCMREIDSSSLLKSFENLLSRRNDEPQTN